MLIEFRVKNFRSLRDDQILSFVPSADRTFRETHCMTTGHKSVPLVTRAAVVYGANAAGKSNLMFALATVRNLVVGSTALPDTQFADLYTPFRLDGHSGTQPTELEITLLQDGVRYQYGFSYDARRILSEWLHVYRLGKPQRWFERRYDEKRDVEEWSPFSAYFKGPRETWRKATRPRALFLTTAVQLNSDLLQPVMEWFTSGLILLNAPTQTISLEPMLQRLDDPDYKSRILDLLRSADIHVADIQVKNRPGQQVELRLEPGKPSEVITTASEIPDIEFLHKVQGGDPVWFDRRYESAGTQRLLAYAGPVLDAIEQGRLLAIDELDRSLHPLLARFIVRLIHNPAVSTKGAQLWITTHDTTLLDTDLLRRDQIWFVEKDESQASRLYPLTDFQPRKNEALERGYLIGRYGGIPFVSEPRFNGSR